MRGGTLYELLTTGGGWFWLVTLFVVILLTALSNPENDSLVENSVVAGLFLAVCQISNQFPILNIVYNNPWISIGFLCLHITLGYVIFVLYSVYNMRRLKAFVAELQKDYAGLKPKCELNW